MTRTGELIDLTVEPAGVEDADRMRRTWTLRDLCWYLQLSERSVRRLRDTTAGFPEPTLNVGAIQRWDPERVLAWFHAGGAALPAPAVDAAGANSTPTVDALMTPRRRGRPPRTT